MNPSKPISRQGGQPLPVAPARAARLARAATRLALPADPAPEAPFAGLILVATEAAVAVALLALIVLSPGPWRWTREAPADLALGSLDPDTTGSVGWPLRSTLEGGPGTAPDAGPGRACGPHAR